LSLVRTREPEDGFDPVDTSSDDSWTSSSPLVSGGSRPSDEQPVTSGAASRKAAVRLTAETDPARRAPEDGVGPAFPDPVHSPHLKSREHLDKSDYRQNCPENNLREKRPLFRPLSR